MASNFNFTTKLGLDATGFKRNVNSVRNSLKGLKSSFLSLAGALGAGLGFAQLIANLKTTATELSVAMNTLKNVSYQTKYFKDGTKDVAVEISNFEENLAFVKQLANDYAQDLVAVTDNYAKFTAACKKTNLGLEDQRFVFESLTKAAAYYHMSADRAKDMMNAVTQMMSKGKVAAEELRRQLGNSLPGAFNIMAAALDETNGSTAKLEELMRAGKIVAAEALPQFAAMLNTITKTAEFDSLQASMNKLKNAWYELVDSAEAEAMFKGLIDGTTTSINFIKNNLNSILSTVKGLVVAIASYKLFKAWEAQGKQYLENQKKNLEELNREYQKFLSAKGLSGGGNGKILGIDVDDVKKNGITDIEDIKAIKRFNENLLETHRIKKELYGIKMLSPNDIKSIKAANIEFDKMIVSAETAKVSTRGISVAMAGLKNMVRAVGVALKSWGIMAIVSAIIGVFTKLASMAKAAREEWERIRGIAQEYQNQSIEVQGSIEAEASILRNNLKILKDTKRTEGERLIALKDINKAMGLVGDKKFLLSDLDEIVGKYDKITASVERWIEATKKQALVQHYANQIAEITAKKAAAEKRKDDAWAIWSDWEGGGDVSVWEGSKAKDAYSKASAEIAQYNKAIKEAEAEMQKAGVAVAEFFSKWDDGSGGNGDGDESALTKLFKKYNESKKELENQLREGAITQDEFNEAFDKLVTEYWKNAAATGELSMSDIISKLDKGSTLKELESWYHQLSKDAAEAAKNALLKSIAEDLIKSVEEEIEEAAEALEREIEKEFEKEAKVIDLDIRVQTDDFDVDPRKNRSSLMDYGKSKSEILGEEFNLSDDWLNDIKKAYGDLIEETNELGVRTETVQKELDLLSEKYRYAAREASTLETAMNYQKIVEDIENVKKEINNLVYSGVKEFATSLDRVVSGWKTLQETMEDDEAGGWEKFMAIFNLMTQIIDGAIGIWQTITTIQELSAKLGAAKIAEQTALNALLKEELALRMAAKGATDAEIAARFSGISALLAEKGVLAGILGIKQAEGAQTATNTALKGAEAAASTTAAAASAGEAVAGATASGSKLPYPLNLLAIATGVAAVIAALAVAGKFAKGGIVGGSSTHGDRNIARVNSGEMILNKAQQGTLFAMLNGKGGMGGNVSFELRGDRLIGVIENTKKKKSK